MCEREYETSWMPLTHSFLSTSKNIYLLSPSGARLPRVSQHIFFYLFLFFLLCFALRWIVYIYFFVVFHSTHTNNVYGFRCCWVFRFSTHCYASHWHISTVSLMVSPKQERFDFPRAPACVWIRWYFFGRTNPSVYTVCWLICYFVFFSSASYFNTVLAFIYLFSFIRCFVLSFFFCVACWCGQNFNCRRKTVNRKIPNTKRRV